MHELSIAMNILTIIEENAALNKLTKVTSAIVKAGELTAVEPETLKFCFNEIKKDTLASEAVLEVEITPLLATCNQCQKDFRIEDLQFFCPDCDNKDIKVTSGEEIILFQLDGEIDGS